MAKERFLILGASSFYGRNFAEYVREQGDEVHEVPREIRLQHSYYYWFANYDYAVNFASKSLVEESWDDPEEWFDVNTVGTSAVFRQDPPSKAFIHVSTPESYGHTQYWVDETYAPWRPSTPYGVSRAAADMMLMAYHRARSFPAIITRTANIYGHGQGAHRIIPLAFDTKRAGATLLLHGGGDTVRSFIHVKDACAATYLIAKQGTVGETYHISTREAVSIKALCERIGVPTGTQPERLGKDHAYLLKSDKVRALGWTDSITLDEGLRQCAEKSTS